MNPLHCVTLLPNPSSRQKKTLPRTSDRRKICTPAPRGLRSLQFSIENLQFLEHFDFANSINVTKHNVDRFFPKTSGLKKYNRMPED